MFKIQETSERKGLEVRVYVTGLRRSKEASVAEAE